jgi:hypothetical protein
MISINHAKRQNFLAKMPTKARGRDLAGKRLVLSWCIGGVFLEFRKRTLKILF